LTSVHSTIGALELDGLDKSFGTVHAASGVSFTVAPGEVFGFVGSNGAGKTTVMRMVLGVLAPDAGQPLPPPQAPELWTDAQRRDVSQ